MVILRIILTPVLAAVVYGIVHNLITAHLCVEYFTVGHPALVKSSSPVVLALVWGTLATWWAGLMLGCGLALAARSGDRPKLEMAELVRPLVRFYIAIALIAAVAGVFGYFTARSGSLQLVGPIAERVPADRHVLFLTAAWVHEGSYLGGFFGGMILWVRIWKRRGKMGVEELQKTEELAER